MDVLIRSVWPHSRHAESSTDPALSRKTEINRNRRVKQQFNKKKTSTSGLSVFGNCISTEFLDSSLLLQNLIGENQVRTSFHEQSL